MAFQAWWLVGLVGFEGRVQDSGLSSEFSSLGLSISHEGRRVSTKVL